MEVSWRHLRPPPRMPPHTGAQRARGGGGGNTATALPPGPAFPPAPPQLRFSPQRANPGPTAYTKSQGKRYRATRPPPAPFPRPCPSAGGHRPSPPVPRAPVGAVTGRHGGPPAAPKGNAEPGAHLSRRRRRGAEGPAGALPTQVKAPCRPRLRRPPPRCRRRRERSLPAPRPQKSSPDGLWLPPRVPPLRRRD